MKRLLVMACAMLVMFMPAIASAADTGAKAALQASQSRLIGAKLSAGLAGVAVLAGVVGKRASGGGSGNGGGGGGGGGATGSQ